MSSGPPIKRLRQQKLSFGKHKPPDLQGTFLSAFYYE